MKITLDNDSDVTRITSYQEGSIRINNETVSTSVVINSDGFQSWPINAVAELTPELFREILQEAPDVVLLGTGKTQVFPGQEILKCMVGLQTGLEIMDTLAACRTYNILVSEGRKVSAALIL